MTAYWGVSARRISAGGAADGIVDAIRTVVQTARVLKAHGSPDVRVRVKLAAD